MADNNAETPETGKAICGAKSRNGSPCKHPAGYGTDHPGQGRCKFHGGASPIKHGRYSKITRPRLKEIIADFEEDPDPLNLLPEIILLRALVQDFVERYDAQTEALIAWHASFNPAFNDSFAKWQQARNRWQELYTEWQEAFQAYRENVEAVQNHYKHGWPEPPTVPPFPDPPEPPLPEDFALKPREVPDILSVGRFITAVGTLVERVEKQRSEGTITLETLRQTMQQFGVELYRGVNEVVPDESLRSAILEAVEGRWGAIELPQPQRRAS